MEFMIYEKKGSIAQITINRPKALNAFNSQMLDELTEALALAEQDPEIRCVILTAAGERAFTAGGDIKEEVQLNEETAKAFSRRGKKMILSILNHRVPVICAVRGYALGGGMEMILAADFTIAASDAKIGIPGWGSTILLPKTVGASRAKELLYTGRSLSAEEAKELGVVEFVVEPDELMKKAFELADVITDMAPLAVENMKRSINTAMSIGLSESLDTETGIFASCFATEDHLEATTAFLEKRGHGEYKRK